MLSGEEQTIARAAALIYVMGGLYLALGLGLWLLLALGGFQRLEPAAKGAGIGFRLITLPTAIALWPLLAFRLIFKAKR